MEIYFKFSKQKKLLAYERHEYTVWKNAWLQPWGCLEQSFSDVTRLNVDELATIVYLVNLMS